MAGMVSQYYITILLALWFCNFKKCELDASGTCIMHLFLSLPLSPSFSFIELPADDGQ